MIKNILVLGAGSAGLLAAITFKRKIPHLAVRVVRSLEIGVIGVGEGTTPNFPKHLFDYLGISRRQFYTMAEPLWKTGIRFLWGARGRFDYTFSLQLDSQWSDLSRPNGYYCDEEFSSADVPSALLRLDKVFTRQPGGKGPDVQPWHGFHIENKKLVDVLERVAREIGVEFIDANVTAAERGPTGVAAVLLEDGRRLEADFFIDSSGFRSELLGRTLEEPFVSYGSSLFCDRAVVGGWAREDEPILPYTTAEAMDAGWSWQIEHEHVVNRGYVYSSHAISDDEAAAEFLRKNPKAPASPRIVKFRTGRYRRLWVDNVVAVGNAAGFVEPLEATALMMVCSQTQTLVEMLLHSGITPTEAVQNLYNDLMVRAWDEIRDFLGLHYKLNTASDTPFWRHCREDTDISNLDPLLEFYRKNGPTGFSRFLIPNRETNFGIEGYLVMLVGNRTPYDKTGTITQSERDAWNRHRADFIAQAHAGMNIREALACIRHPGWKWHAE